jgi:hypothetical protein
MKQNKFFYTLLFFAFFTSAIAQDSLCYCPQRIKTGKGTFYFSWGYNRDWYSKSDMHFKNTSNEYNAVTQQNDYYDFTLYDVKATDRPGFDNLLTTPLTIPQYSYRLGYFFNNKKDFGIEINFDHSKYMVTDYQTVRLKGNIRGKYYDNDTVLDPNTFLHFQHTNGANFMMLNFVKRQSLLVSKKQKHWLSAVVKLGGGIVIPRTFVTMWGQQSNNYWNIAGYCAGAEVGLRYDFFKYIYLEYTAKEIFAHYKNTLLIGSGRANHHFFAFENILVLGFQFPL